MTPTEIRSIATAFLLVGVAFLVARIDYWRKRAEAAEDQNVWLRKMVLEKTGTSVEMWAMADAAKLALANPRHTVIITGIDL